MSKDKELAVSASGETLQALAEAFPVEPRMNKMFFPRLGFYSQDQKEGKGKAMKVVTEAGTFYLEEQTEELDENQKRIWKKTEIGNSVEGIILYFRKQLKFFDGTNYTSSPIYDTDDEILPLFSNKAEVDRGTPAELKARPQYQGKSAKGKDISKLEENKVVYILMEGQTYQMNLRGSSMYAFSKFKQEVMPPTVLTKITSEARENGSIAWNQMIFTPIRKITEEEARLVSDQIDNIRGAVASEKALYASQAGNVIDGNNPDEIFKKM